MSKPDANTCSAQIVGRRRLCVLTHHSFSVHPLQEGESPKRMCMGLGKLATMSDFLPSLDWESPVGMNL